MKPTLPLSFLPKVSSYVLLILLSFGLSTFLYGQAETESNNSVNDANVQTVSASTTVTGDVCLGGGCAVSDPTDWWKIADGSSGSFIATWSDNVQVTLFTYSTSARNTAPTSVVLTSGASQTLSASSFYAINMQFVSIGVLTSYSVVLSGTSLPASNAAPTAASFTAANGPYEDLTYTFATGDFGYVDGDGDALDHVRVTAIPASGTLYVDADNDDTFDGGEAVAASDQISKADLDAGNLQYIQNGSTGTSFTFDVNDGTDYSATTYTATLSVLPIPTVTLGISPTSRSESTTTANVVTATLSNTYGVNTVVTLSFSGTATGSGVDYSTSATSITVTAGATSNTMNITNVTDALYEGNETVIIDINGVTGGTESGTQQVTYTITDDDSQPNATLYTRSIYNPITDESGGQAYIIAEIDAVAGTTITVPLGFSGTASGGGTDYSITGTTITLSPGETSDSIRITSQFDGIEEGSETVIIDMNPPTNAVESGTQQVTVTIEDEDATFPSTTLSSTAGNPTNSSPIPVTITFSESVTGFTVGDITVGNGAASNFAGSGDTYTVDITPSGDGAVTVNVGAGVAADGFGNANTAATQLSRTYDTSPPTTAITSGASNPTNSSPFSVTITFSESVTGFALGDISVGNGAASNFAGSGDTYTADITPSGDGTVTVDVSAGVATDAAGNGNTVATQFSTVYDATSPTTSITSGVSNPTSSSPFSVTITFSESVTGLALGDITVGNGAASNLAGSGDTYTADITPSADGTVTVDVAAGVAVDGAGNGNTVATQFSTVYDGTAPTTAITSGVSNPTNSSPFSVTITFSESVTGFTVGGLIVGNGNASNFAGSGDTYTADITPTADGTVTVDVAGATVTDGAGNGNTAASQFSTVYDATGPTTSITTGASNPTNSSPFSVTITFSESVTGFALGDISVGNGAASNFAGSGDTYTADITPSADGTVTVDVGAAVAADGAGNSNSAATQLSLTYDGTAPTASLSTGAGDPTNSSPFSVTITFSESVTGLALGDITVGNGAASNLAGAGDTYTVDITPSADGIVTVDVGAGVANDNAGNGNTAATQLSLTYDGTAPTTTITSGASDPTNSSPFSVTITFSESVTGFALGDISVGNGAASNLAGAGDTYTADITPSADGTVTVDVGAGLVVDNAGNSNTAATQFSLTYDTSNPTTTITSGATNPTSSSPFSVTITFSESVTGFALGDITVGNGAASNFAGAGDTYTADITPAGDGTVTVDVAAGVAVDAAGNSNTVATQYSTIYDGTAPATTIASAVSNPTNSSPFSVTITFSESVTGFALGDITVGNGAASNFAGSGDTYTADITPAGDGTVTVDVGAGVAADNAGNNNTAATQFSTVYDATAPTTSIASGAANPTNSSPFSVTITFSESVTGFALGDITVGNGAASNLAGAGDTYTADITPAADGTVTVDVAAGVAVDDAGNSNTVATQYSTVYDGTAPTGYAVTIDLLGETQINVINETIIEFNGTGLEVGATLNYSFTSDGGGTPVSGTETVTTASETFNNGGAGYDLSGLTDGTVTLSVTLTDVAGNTGTTATASETKDAGPPVGYTVAWDDALINATEAAATSFTVSNAEIGTTINYTISSSGDGNTATVTGSATVATSTQQVTVDVSSLTDGTLTVDMDLTDGGGNTGATQSDNSATLDQTAPAAFTVSMDDALYNATEATSASFTFASADVGTSYSYTISSSGGGTNATGTGTISTATDQITGIDLSALGDGTLTLSVTLSDAAGNTTSDSDASSSLDATAPAFSSVDDNGGDNNYRAGESLTIVADLGEAGLTVTADLSVINSGLGAAEAMTDNADGTYSVTIADVDNGGLMIEGTGIAVTITATDAAGNSNTDNSLSLALDKTAPTGYTVSMDDAFYNNTNETAASFTFASAEVGTDYSYSITSDGGAGTVSGTGTIATASDQITGIDISGLPDGNLTLSVTLTDAAGNTGASATDNTSVKDTSVPVFVSVSASGDGTYTDGEGFTITVDLGEAGLTVTADLSGINSSFSATAAFTDNADGTYSFVIADVNSGGTGIDGTHGITVSASDDAGNVATDNSLSVAIDLIAPVIDAGQSFTIAENQALSASIGTVTATETGTLQGWTITSNYNPDGDANGAFAIDASTGELTVNDADDFDYELSTGGSITLTVSDGVSTSASETVTITITDENDNSPVFTGTPYTATLDETDPVGTSVATVAATDADAGANGTVSFSITAGNTNSDFSIDASTGEITIANALDAGITASYTLTVTATDGGAPANTTTASVTITVNSVNSNDPIFQGTPYAATVSESATIGTTVITVTATDADTGTDGTVSYGITAGNTGNAFAIGAGSGVITVAAALDFETTASYTLTILASDGGSPTRSTTETVTITVSNANDNSPVFTGTPYTATLAEDVTTGTSVATVAATDADGDNISFSITAGDAGGDFAIDAATGAITTAQTLDFETSSSYTLTVTATDDGSPANSTTETVTVTITDVNDNAPVFTGTPYTSTIAEDVAVGTSVLTVSSTDADAGANATVTYSITAGNAAGDFTIDAATGEITTVNALNAEATASYTLTITATDGGTPANSTTETVTITVSNVNDNAPVTADDSYTVDEDASLSVTAATGVLANDTDADGDALTAVLQTGPTNGTLTLNADGSFTYTPNADYFGADSFTYMADDGANQSGVATVSLTINPINDAPTITGFGDLTIGVNSNTGDLSFTINDIDNDVTTLTVTGSGDNANLIDATSFAFGGTGTDRTVNITPITDAQGIANITITVSDGTATASFFFVLTVRPENLPPVAISFSTTQMIESTQVGDVVGTLTTTDPDAADTHTYELVAGTGDADNAFFSITGDQVILEQTAVAALMPQLTFRVRSTDPAGEFLEEDFIVNVISDPSLDPDIPSGFTPNGDGANDTWNIRFLDDPNAEITVINRNGQEVFSSTGYSTEWDGLYEGEELPTGTYYFVIKLSDGRTYTGPVTLFR